MTNSNGGKQAVVLSGGGANGAYEVGVLKALFAGKSPATDEKPLDPDIFSGTSVGSYNAAFLVSRWDVYGTAAISSLEEAWLSDISSDPPQKPDNGVFRLLNNPWEFVYPQNFLPNPLQPFNNLLRDSLTLGWDGLQRAVNLLAGGESPLLKRIVELFNFSSFVSVEPLRHTVEEVWFSEIRRSKKALRIATTNWLTGTSKSYDNHEMTDQLGPLIILGSTAIPGFFPATAIGSQLFVDGGVLLNTPLWPAYDAGADILHVITLFPNVERIPLSLMTNTLETLYRQQIIGWIKAFQRDIETLRTGNRLLELVRFTDEVRQNLEISPDVAPLEGALGREFEQDLEIYRGYRPLTVHLYFPNDDISGSLGLLDFSRNRIKCLIERGFEDTIDHDCGRNECVLPRLPTCSSPPANSEC